MTTTQYKRINTRRQNLSNALASLANARLTLDDFLAQASILDNRIANALAGIYCGTEGRVIDAFDDNHSIVVGWYNKRVEYAYIG